MTSGAALIEAMGNVDEDAPDLFAGAAGFDTTSLSELESSELYPATKSMLVLPLNGRG